jgi:RNA polymerase sigma-70 factor (ECF subfamily)
MERKRQAQFEALLQPILDSAYGTAVHLSRNRDDAADLVQEAALLAYRAFDSFQPGTNFRAWFFKILTNVFYQKYRQRRREPEIAPLEDAAELYLYAQSKTESFQRSSDPAAEVLAKMDTESVCAALEALPEEYRIVCTLYFMEQFSYEEIADVANCPIGTVRSRLHRGRKMLQKALWRLVEHRDPAQPTRTG